ncbi:MAG: F0F1 ATP synthase subunit B [Cyanobacteria bacterium P01_D01_bin.123]
MIGPLLGLAATIPVLAEAAVAEAVEEAGFGFNPDILGSNAINIVLIVAFLVYVGKSVIGGILSERKAEIVKEIESAELRQKEALDSLAGQQEKLAQAQQEAERIKQKAEATAQKVREDILAQAERDIEQQRAVAEREIASERTRVADRLRRNLVRQALERVEAELPSRLDEGTQGRLIDSSIQLLGGR